MKNLILFITVLFAPVAAFAQEVVEATVVEGWDASSVASALEFFAGMPVVGQYAVLLFALIGAFAAVATFLPIGTPGGLWWKFRKLVIDLGGMNLGNAKNAKNG